MNQEVHVQQNYLLKGEIKIFPDKLKTEIIYCFENEEKNWRTHISLFQNILKAAIIKTLWYWHKDRCIDEWNRI